LKKRQIKSKKHFLRWAWDKQSEIKGRKEIKITQQTAESGINRKVEPQESEEK